ncbi:DNA-binding domain-containing protein [Vibrio rarus]|uniref:HvfC/BufC N-terminal domain-containing protein n=1 Tax=Vibrio rarus TaxID=413403 RepID=UPI0021C3EE6E|nr:DNA-binding domain-containing protein [Vibrio rarus]
MISLADLQHNFARALTYQGDVRLCHIHSDHFSDQQRMQIYRNNVIHSFTDVLQAMYPNTRQLVGDECFTQMARQHVLTSPSTNGNVSVYGQGFDRTIRLFPKVMATAPYLPEVAKYEAMCDHLQNNVHNLINLHYQPLSELNTLTEVQQQNIRLVTQIGAHSFASQFAIFDLISAIAQRSFDELHIHQAQQGYINVTEDQHTHYHTLDNASFQLLTAIEAQCPLSKIAQHLLPNIPILVERALIAGFTTQ